MAFGCGYAGGFTDGCATVPGCTGGGYATTRYGGVTYGGGALCLVDCFPTDEEIAGHEIAGTCVNKDAIFPLSTLDPQTYGCGNGYAGGQFAALLYGGGVPCNGQFPTPLTAIQSNVEEFCILSSSCR